MTTKVWSKYPIELGMLGQMPPAEQARAVGRVVERTALEALAQTGRPESLRMEVARGKDEHTADSLIVTASSVDGEVATTGKVWDVAALGNNPAETWGNTLLFQLATALGEHPIDGRLLVDPDEILQRALDAIREQQQAAEGADEQEAMMLRNAEATRRSLGTAGASALREAADAVPVDLWATYGLTPRRAVEGFQEWLRGRADKIGGGQ